MTESTYAKVQDRHRHSHTTCRKSIPSWYYTTARRVCEILWKCETRGPKSSIFQNFDRGNLVWFLFYGPSTHFRSFQARSVTLTTLFLLGSLPVLIAHSFASNWQLLFLNQWKRENGRRIFFVTKCPRKNVRIELRATCMPSGHAFDRATCPAPRQCPDQWWITFGNPLYWSCQYQLVCKGQFFLFFFCFLFCFVFVNLEFDKALTISSHLISVP